MRKDGREEPIRWSDRKYDRESTTRLIALFRVVAPVEKVLFNDVEIPLVITARHHITCIYTASDKATKDGPYRCWIGIDLRTGDSIGTVSC
ncbi:hypothetical protein [Pseudoduganella chitinolytica]|uniref:Transposase n=1 Tax=Pseudoduganella chitinolytica TaxID=34070 RepID=A0ABY8BHM8_9BURK|nr:hypothetical protein [Pseudoduganella chitinolytica]WEF35462.1 hypothetical protein PX653_12135 [Pseudoduganella chitinolytica]